MIERIESFRKRRPRLREEIITLAHGAGGKSSTALVDSVFVEAFPQRGARVARRRCGPRAAQRGAAGVQHRLLRRAAAALPGWFDRSPRGARHGQRPGDVRRCAVLDLGGVRAEEGFSIAVLREIVADMATAEAAGVKIVTGDPKVVPTGAADGLFITTTGVGVIPSWRQLSAAAVRPGTG